MASHQAYWVQALNSLHRDPSAHVPSSPNPNPIDDARVIVCVANSRLIWHIRGDAQFIDDWKVHLYAHYARVSEQDTEWTGTEHLSHDGRSLRLDFYNGGFLMFSVGAELDRMNATTHFVDAIPGQSWFSMIVHGGFAKVAQPRADPLPDW